MPPTEQNPVQLNWLPDELAVELQAYAEEHSLSIDDAIVRLASAQLDMRKLERSLGVEGFSRAPK